MTKPNKYDHIIFHHLPKCGGTAVAQAIRRNFASSEIYTIYGDIKQQIMNFGDSMANLSPQPRLIMGHMTFGLHRYLGGKSTYFTFVRRPEQRVLSIYRYLKGFPETREGALLNRLTLVEALESGEVPALSDGMMRDLVGTSEIIPYGTADREWLDQALQNIREHYCFVGIVEDLLFSFYEVSRLLGFKGLPFLTRDNVTPGRPAILTEEKRSAIARYNAFDAEIYEHCRAKLINKHSCRSINYALFERANWVYDSLRNRPPPCLDASLGL